MFLNHRCCQHSEGGWGGGRRVWSPWQVRQLRRSAGGISHTGTSILAPFWHHITPLPPLQLLNCDGSGTGEMHVMKTLNSQSKWAISCNNYTPPIIAVVSVLGTEAGDLKPPAGNAVGWKLSFKCVFFRFYLYFYFSVLPFRVLYQSHKGMGWLVWYSYW